MKTDNDLANQSRYHFPIELHEVLDAENIEIAGKHRKFDATLVSPRDCDTCRAVAVFIGGSGSYDRHGLHDQFDIGYHRFLDRLAVAGIASIRFDKVREQDALPEYDLNARLDEIENCFGVYGRSTKLRHLPRIVVGHSEGALVAAEYAVGHNNIEGVVYLSGPAKPIRSIMRDQACWTADQLEFSEEEKTQLFETQDRFLDFLDGNGQDPEAYSDYRHCRKYVDGVFKIDPLETIAKLKSSLLIVHGVNDVQIPVEHARQLSIKACSTGLIAKCVVLKDHDHLLRVNKNRGLENLSDYKNRRKRIRAATISRISRSILKMVSASQQGL
jgi:hypothetical protein